MNQEHENALRVSNIIPLDKYSLISNYDLFKEIFLEKDQTQFLINKEKLKDTAKSLGLNKGDFEKHFRIHYSKYNSLIKTKHSNTTSFNDAPLVLECGEWVANDLGIWRMKETASKIVKVMACNHAIIISEIYINIYDRTEKVRLHFFSKEKTWQSIIVDKSTICNNQKIINLSDLGIEVTTESTKDLISYLSSLINLNIDTIPIIKSTSKLGWAELEERKVFLPYSDNIKFDGELTFSDIYNCFSEKGDYDSWLSQTKKNRDYSLVIRLLIASSFASPILNKIGALPFILHLWGGTGTGKTVALMAGASIWGNPEIGKLVMSLNNTAVSFELTANFLNNVPMFCDELHLIKDSYQYKNGYNQLIMQLCGGFGRGRGSKEGGKQALTAWRNCFVFSGEEPLLNDSTGGGARNRVIEIETTKKIIEDGYKESNFYRKNYGFAGKIFIEKLQEIDEGELISVYEKFKNELMESSTEKQALSMACILLADYISAKYIFFDTPLKVDDVKEFMQSKDEINIYKRSFEWILSFIEINKIRFIENSDINRGEIWGKLEEDKNYCLVNRKIIESKMKDEGYSFQAVVKKWAEYKYIEQSKDKKNTVSSYVAGKQDRFVKVILNTPDEIFTEIEEEPPKEFQTSL